MIEVKIGVLDGTKEIELELNETADSFQKMLKDSAGASKGLFWVVDRRGHRVGLAADKITYVEIEPEVAARSVGFAP